MKEGSDTNIIFLCPTYIPNTSYILLYCTVAKPYSNGLKLHQPPCSTHPAEDVMSSSVLEQLRSAHEADGGILTKKHGNNMGIS